MKLLFAISLITAFFSVPVFGAKQCTAFEDDSFDNGAIVNTDVGCYTCKSGKWYKSSCSISQSKKQSTTYSGIGVGIVPVKAVIKK